MGKKISRVLIKEDSIYPIKKNYIYVRRYFSSFSWQVVFGEQIEEICEDCEEISNTHRDYNKFFKFLDFNLWRGNGIPSIDYSDWVQIF